MNFQELQAGQPKVINKLRVPLGDLVSKNQVERQLSGQCACCVSLRACTRLLEPTQTSVRSDYAEPVTPALGGKQADPKGLLAIQTSRNSGQQVLWKSLS